MHPNARNETLSRYVFGQLRTLDSADADDVLYHVTANRHLDSILQQGLVKGRRHHVHVSTDKETMIQVGMRHGDPVLLSIDAKRLMADGHEFIVAGNHV